VGKSESLLKEGSDGDDGESCGVPCCASCACGAVEAEELKNETIQVPS
jgi:hypothetical protein